MLSSDLLYGGLDVQTAIIQKDLFERKKEKAYLTLGRLNKDFNLMDFSEKQDRLQWRINKIKKAIQFCTNQIDEAKGVLRC